jgi:hypothetical protein
MGQSYTSRPLVACYRVTFTFLPESWLRSTEYCCNGTVRGFQHDMVCVCVLTGDKGITSLEPQTMPHKHSLSQWEVYIICQFLSHEGAYLRHEKREL